MKSKRIARWRFMKLLGMAGASLGILLLLTFFTHLKFKESEESAEWSRHTLEVLTGIADVRTNVFELSTSVRGFAITNSHEMYAEYKVAAKDVVESLENLKKLIRDNDTQIQNLQEVKQEIFVLLEYYETSTAFMLKGDQEELKNRIKSGTGQKLLTQLKLSLKQMVEIEEALLSARLAEEKVDRKATDLINVMGSLAAISFVIFFIALAYTEHAKALSFQEDLNENMQVQKALLNAASFALIAADLDGRITHINPAAEKLLGYSSAESLGQNMMDVHLPEEVLAKQKLLSEEFAEEIGHGFDILRFRPDRGIIESDQWSFRRKDGIFIPVRLTLSPLKDNDGKIYGYIGVCLDIVKQLEFEKTLINAREDAISGTRAKSEFLANMSHEIRTPMNAILGMAELLRTTELSEEQNRYVQIFQNAGASLLNLINDILDLSKIEAGHFEIESEPFKLNSVIEKSVSIIALKAHEKNLELSVDLDESLNNDFLGDANRIQQVLLNFLGNAVKFTAKGEVTLRVFHGTGDGEGPNEIIIEIMDTGIGMNEEQVSRLFQRFSQADSTITRKFGGTGLGLNISKKLVELMGGDVTVQSVPSVGTKFRVTILLQGIKTEESFTHSTIKLDGKRFLIVDDTKTNRLIVRKILERRGAIVLEAESGSEALKVISDSRKNNDLFDMILLDYRMPEMSGFQVVEKIQEEHGSNSPMLMMLTSDDVPGSHSKAKKLGLKAHLIKPVLPHILLEFIEKSLASRPEIQQSTEPVVEQKPLPRTLNVLLVDDNADNRLIIKSFVKTLSLNIDEARDGNECLKLHAGKDYDLILMDMQMPVKDGFTTTSEIRAIEATGSRTYTPIIALSAFAMKDEIDKTVEAGCNSHLPKPIGRVVLLKRIEEILALTEISISDDMWEMAEEYLNSRRQDMSRLLQHLKEKDFESLQKSGHKIFGSAGSYGFEQLSEIGQKIEEAARLRDFLKINQAIGEIGVALKNTKIHKRE